MERRKPSINEPVTLLRRVPIQECGDPLADFTKVCPQLLIDPPRFRYRRETLIRAPVAEMLCKAANSLPEGYRLAIVEGWRPPHIQRRMYQWSWNRFAERHPEWSEAQLKRVVNRFTAPLNDRVPPPHSTGGAVDLTLYGADGKPAEFRKPYPWMDTRAYPFDAPGLGEEARRNRQILAEALLRTGLTNYPSEYWHWSYGDQGWAYRGHHPHALFGPIVPPDYEPAPEDLAEGPLEWIYPPEE